MILLPWSIARLPPRPLQTNSLNWRKAQDRVDADISSWDVRQLLEHVAADTGWHIYLDPDAIHKVSAKFKNLSAGEALHSLLGTLNFVVVPQAHGSFATLRVFANRTSRQQATTLIAPASRKPAQPIPNELVVTLKRAGSKTKIDDLARSLGRKSHWPHGQSARLPAPVSG